MSEFTVQACDCLFDQLNSILEWTGVGGRGWEGFLLPQPSLVLPFDRYSSHYFGTSFSPHPSAAVKIKDGSYDCHRKKY